jgi:hypothetical protein
MRDKKDELSFEDLKSDAWRFEPDYQKVKGFLAEVLHAELEYGWIIHVVSTRAAVPRSRSTPCSDGNKMRNIVSYTLPISMTG